MGKTVLKNAEILKRVYDEFKKRLRDEWDKRARRRGLEGMYNSSIPEKELEQVSQEYISSTLAFMGNELDGKDVLEIGCGIGLLSKEIVKRVKSLTASDISPKMIERSRMYLGTDSEKVNYKVGLFQEFTSEHKI